MTQPIPRTLAVPAGDEVHVWWSLLPGTGLPDGVRDGLTRHVDPATLERLGRMRRAEDRDRGLAAHALLRRLLGATLGERPSSLRFAVQCGSCGSTEHGKPRLDGDPVLFNLSHSGLVVAVALAARPVGVDVEQDRAVKWATLRRSVFGDEEWAATGIAADPDAARLAGWARKEAAVKATGHGIALSLSRVAVAGAPAGSWTAVLPEGAGTVSGADLGTTTGHAGAVAVVGPGSPLVTSHQAAVEPLGA